jgi:hypothetical protein
MQCYHKGSTRAAGRAGSNADTNATICPELVSGYSSARRFAMPSISARACAYDRESHIGRLDKALAQARERGWIVASMKSDFGTVFAK